MISNLACARHQHQSPPSPRSWGPLALPTQRIQQRPIVERVAHPSEIFSTGVRRPSSLLIASLRTPDGQVGRGIRMSIIREPKSTRLSIVFSWNSLLNDYNLSAANGRTLLLLFCRRQHKVPLRWIWILHQLPWTVLSNNENLSGFEVPWHIMGRSWMHAVVKAYRSGMNGYLFGWPA